MNVAKRPLVEAVEVTKSFPGQQALAGVSFDLYAGEIHALVGENGAGKSTLIKILSGALPLDKGVIRIDGEEVVLGSPSQAMRKGISTIYQDRILVPGLTVAENIALGHEPKKGRFLPLISNFEVALGAQKAMTLLEFEVDLNAKVRDLSVAQQQLVAIAKALFCSARVLILDEPTSPLSEEEAAHLFRVLRQLKSQGMGIIYITHRLEEIPSIADRVTVMKDGTVVCTKPVEEMGKQELIRHMVGRELGAFFPVRSSKVGDEVLRVVRLTKRGEFEDVSFNIKAGEIVGLAGLVGSGRTPLVRALFGAEPYDSGEIYLLGRRVDQGSPSRSEAAGMGFVPADRKREGLVMGFSIKENTTLSALSRFVRLGLVDGRKEASEAYGYKVRLGVRALDIDTRVRALSGGNQQKVLVARTLCGQSRVLIFDEPTCGVDVGAKAEDGTAILLTSSDTVELLGLCDRIIVIHRGRIAGEFTREEATEEKIVHCAFIGMA